MDVRSEYIAAQEIAIALYIYINYIYHKVGKSTGNYVTCVEREKERNERA